MFSQFNRIIIVGIVLAFGNWLLSQKSVSTSIAKQRRLVFLNAFVELIAKPYGEFESLPDNEKRIRLFHAFSRDTYLLVSSYIKANPTEDPAMLKVMRELDAVAVQESELHAKMISEGRFDYTDVEKELAKELRGKSALLAGSLCRFLEP